MARHTGPTLAQVAVAEQKHYGDWIVKSHSGDSKRKVVAECTSCHNDYVVDIYELNRTRKPTRCQGCSNRIIIANNRLSPGEALQRREYNAYAKNARAKGNEWFLSFEDFLNYINDDCYYCGQKPNRIVESGWDKIYVNGIDRVDNSLGYSKENCVTACKDCNYAKRTLGQEVFIDLCRRVAAKHDSSDNRSQTKSV